MQMQELRIPKERIAVLVGKKGEVKKELEKKLRIKLEIDSEEGDVIIKGEDSLKVFDAKKVVQAVGRGFNPEIAIQLDDEDFILEIINVKDFSKSKKSLIRLKGRVIGAKGKCRNIIEEMTGVDICIYGKTVGIIGRSDKVALARRAVESLLSGMSHGPIYKWLEEQVKRG